MLTSAHSDRCVAGCMAVHNSALIAPPLHERWRCTRSAGRASCCGPALMWKASATGSRRRRALSASTNRYWNSARCAGCTPLLCVPSLSRLRMMTVCVVAVVLPASAALRGANAARQLSTVATNNRVSPSCTGRRGRALTAAATPFGGVPMHAAHAYCAYCFTVCATGEISLTEMLGSECSPVAPSCRHATDVVSTSATAMRRSPG